MKKLLAVTGAAFLLATPLAVDVHAQGQQQSVTLMRVDPASVSTGHRASKVNGSTVVNERNETVGEVDDVIIGDNGKTPYAVLSVGGFLGMGEHLVAVPYTSLQMTNERVVLAGATKDALKALPEFKYATK